MGGERPALFWSGKVEQEEEEREDSDLFVGWASEQVIEFGSKCRVEWAHYFWYTSEPWCSHTPHPPRTPALHLPTTLPNSKYDPLKIATNQPTNKGSTQHVVPHSPNPLPFHHSLNFLSHLLNSWKLDTANPLPNLMLQGPKKMKQIASFFRVPLGKLVWTSNSWIWSKCNHPEANILELLNQEPDTQTICKLMFFRDLIKLTLKLTRALGNKLKSMLP